MSGQPQQAGHDFASGNPVQQLRRFAASIIGLQRGALRWLAGRRGVFEQREGGRGQTVQDDSAGRRRDLRVVADEQRPSQEPAALVAG
jgi:hypothetical protein